MDIPLRTHPRTQDLRYTRTWDTGTCSSADARDAVAALLAEAWPAPVRRSVQDAQLVVSELVTNAEKHAPGPCALSLELGPGGRALRICVTDTSTEPPRPRPPDPGRVGGHGLHLVTMLARNLEVAVLPEGKRVTATVPLVAEGAGSPHGD
ncbi:ATP-binding protein [Streptomyces sp. NPDC048106]|uniref:ATP-binding protein n=1 Tax=Streptomyces sp. NPDC048106 TaxID=3155750 RepID=UPI0034518320